MKMTMRILILIWIAACLGASPDANEIRRRPLKGVTQMKVFVTVSKDINEAAAIEQYATTALELPLRKLGIKIGAKGDDVPALEIIVSVSRVNPNGGLLYDVALQFGESVQLLRTKQVVFANTWHDGVFGIAPTGDAAKKIEDAISPLIDKFTNDLLAANSESSQPAP